MQWRGCDESQGHHVSIFYQRSTRRPIVSACNCPTENIASYLDMVMSPLVCNLNTYVKDSNHALEIFRTFQFDNDDTSQRFLYTMDIKSLYTVIPHNSGLETLKYFLDKRPVLTHGNTHSSSGIGAYPERILVQQRILPSSGRGGHGQQNGPKLRMSFCGIC